MSYQTNPILNRIKIRKGWKNSHFPLEKLQYSHEIILWFKLYLFLKNFLFLQQIIVLTCEIRLADNHKKILYLSVTKHFQQKNFRKSKWKSQSLLRETKSLLTKIDNKKARFLLYQDLKTLKKNSFFFLNQTTKKILLNPWIAKPRFSSWINTSKFSYALRHKKKTRPCLAWKKKEIFWLKKNATGKLKKTVFKNILEREIFSKQIFWQRKQKKLLSFLSKNQKELSLLEKNWAFILDDKIEYKAELFFMNHIQKNLILKLRIRYNNQKRLLKKVKKLYSNLINTQFVSIYKKENVLEKRLIQNSSIFSHGLKTQKKRRNLQLKLFWSSLKKQLWNFHNKEFSFSNKRKAFIIWTSHFFKKTQKYRLMNAKFQLIFSTHLSLYLQKTQANLTKKIVSDSNYQRIGLYNIFLKNIWQQNFHNLSTFPKTKFLRKRKKILPWYLTQLLRFKQQFKISYLKKKDQGTFDAKEIVKSLSKKEKRLNYLFYEYRWPFNLLYKNQLILWTGFQLTSLLQSLIRTYFGLHFTIKISWPLIQFKNLKFYRLLFPTYKKFNFENNSQEDFRSLKLRKKNFFKGNPYLYIGQPTTHLKVHKSIVQLCEKKNFSPNFYNKFKVFKKSSKPIILYRLDLKKAKKTGLKKLNISGEKKTEYTSQKEGKSKQKDLFLVKVKKDLLKKNSYFLLKSRILQEKSQARLFWSTKTPDIGNFLTTLALFSKYLDPQPLVNHLAKLIGQSKNHSSLIKFLEKILNAIQMKRGIGYRIALIGRIDGANKSRTLYLRKLNLNRPRQTFVKNVNFAMAQARASIGAFNIKLWIYF